jgi:bifunctional non-homologous end joining protein LigD
MRLKKYKEKRNFDSTAEPIGKNKSSGEELIFVVQKHAATRLHYDLRLEMEGVLKSWAVPKGPSMNPNDKRLAVMVEDHPYDYKDFEGNIAPGNYGAGNVIVWDNGTYEPTTVEKDKEKTPFAQLAKGHLRFNLHGHKLKGEFSLVKLKGKEENAWLLIKHSDEFSTDKDILKQNKSVITGASLESLQAKFPKEKKGQKKAKRTEVSEIQKGDVQPTFISPMLAETATKPFSRKNWIFEIKYDGYRTIAVVKNGKVELFSRNQLSFTKSFLSIASSLKTLQHDCVLDGEVVIEDKTGRSDFQLLQNFRKTGSGELKYYVFDILNLDGNDTRNLTLLERKELLKLMLENNPLDHIFYSDHVIENGVEFYKLAVEKNLEGVMAKSAESPYRTGKRSSEWLKIKHTLQEEVVIAGITEPKGARNYFGALVMAQYVGDRLEYVGNCGTGFSEEVLKDLYERLQTLFIEKSPFDKKIKIAGKVQWVIPKLVAQVKFTERTEEGHFRHPVYLGLRDDKTPEDVKPDVENIEDKSMGTETRQSEYDLKIGRVKLHLTNQNKIYFPESGYTKGDVVDYYREVSEFILPYLKDRPQSMNRFPHGINGKSFYQKDVDVDKIPSWLKTAQIYSESNKKEIDYLLCNDEATLVYMANLGCIEINPWSSTLTNIERPDWLVIDLDPESIEFNYVVETALVVKKLLDELNVPCYCKTSGSTGLHVYVPLAAKYDYETVKIFAKLIAHSVNVRVPKITSIERLLKKRQNRVYVDFLQNRKGQTIAAPYSVRPKPGATVSMPLQWDEVNVQLSPSQFTIKNALKRLESTGDLWKPILSKGVDIESIIAKIEEE